MDPSTFRRDPFLRTSAYHLATWSLVGCVLELRVAAADSAGAPQLPVVAVLVAGAALTSLTHERRVGKMAGPAAQAVYAGAGRLWLGLIVVFAAAGLLLWLQSRPQWLFDAAAFEAGIGFAIWGWKAGFAWYAGLGLALVVLGAVDIVLAAAGEPVLALRVPVLALVLPAFALLTNRRFLWFRPSRAG